MGRISRYGMFAGALLSLYSVGGERRVYAQDATGKPVVEDLSRRMRDLQKTDNELTDDSNVQGTGDYRQAQGDLDELDKESESSENNRQPKSRYNVDGLVGGPNDLNAQLAGDFATIGEYLLVVGRTSGKDNYVEKEKVKEVKVRGKIEYRTNKNGGIPLGNGFNWYIKDGKWGFRFTLNQPEERGLGFHYITEDIIVRTTLEGVEKEPR